MILIADSGSTKTHWCLIENGVEMAHFFSKGINPFYQPEEEIGKEIDSILLPEIKTSKVESIYFYGAGCSFPDKIKMVSNQLGLRFHNALIEVQSDLLAAARSLFINKEGIACILGTGSNSCYYDGVNIVKNISPLGFILGDEGSGAVLSKMFVSDCLKNQIPSVLKEKFFKKYDLTPQIILEKVYKESFPNRYLASFTPFLSENIDEPSILNIVYSGFNAFFERNVMQYPLSGLKVSFVGSVAFYFENVLRDSATVKGIEIEQIVQNPMEGLIRYHSFSKK
jgi:N-acetylglucosamine kinase-like BadF-type ATPase